MNILYIIGYRGCNPARIKNLKLTLQWLKQIKNKLTNPSDLVTPMTFDIVVVEQDSHRQMKINSGVIETIFIYNQGVFNKCWGFNVAVKQYPQYDYYIFADNDLIFPDIDGFCHYIRNYCLIDPKPVFRLFSECLDTALDSMKSCHKVKEILSTYQNQTLQLKKHRGVTFAGGMIAISRSIYEKIGGWDEKFEGWGRHDDFMTLKLFKIAQCEKIICPLVAIHLWHPITGDFNLKKEIVILYNQYSHLSDDILQKISQENRLIMGNPIKYSHLIVQNPPPINPPVTSKPLTTPPVINQSVTTKPSTTPPVINQTSTTPPVINQPVTTQPITSPTVTIPPVTSKPITTPPVTNRPVTTPPVINQHVTIPPVTSKPSTTPHVINQPVTNPPVTTPSITTPAITTPAMTIPPVTTPAMTILPVTLPPVTIPPVINQPVTSKPVIIPPVT